MKSTKRKMHSKLLENEESRLSGTSECVCVRQKERERWGGGNSVNGCIYRTTDNKKKRELEYTSQTTHN